MSCLKSKWFLQHVFVFVVMRSSISVQRLLMIGFFGSVFTNSIFAETLTVSYTDIPETIRVGLTGYENGRDWRKDGKVIAAVIEVPFQEYVKDVLAHEWRFSKDTADTPGAVTIQKVGAMAVKTISWWMINLPPGQGKSRHHLPGHPDIVDNTDDHVYLQPACHGDNTPLCKGLSSFREIGGFGDQAVEATWTTLLKRRDCFRYRDACPDVLNVQYRTTQAGCDADQVASFCIPQKEARAKANTLTWEAILNTYYDTSNTILPAIYAQQPLQVRQTAEALSSCLEIRKDDDWPLYGCRVVKQQIARYACPLERHRSQKKDTETQYCPSSAPYIALDTHGVILDVKEKTVQKTVKTTT